ncbi:Fic family protein [Lacticaseibacillus mingshuiensis]|uniref:Fic family protein n=1 Tax=Lacticaseibacillus mingshuiensis TaxID=2799574 RepID=A0ABW4CHC1_9LACO|nr:Fic family protein [Lacticaseibacillus mingshuiensis]
MKTFDYSTLNNLVITPEMTTKISQIGELRGQLAQLAPREAAVLDRLLEVAKIQSTDASNRIEGIFTSDTRLRQLVQHRIQPHDRSEEEISGYRDVLDLIHDQYAYMPIRATTILALHKKLFAFTASTWGGQFKDRDNQIVTVFEDGTTETRFTPAPAIATPQLMTDLCQGYEHALMEAKMPAVLLAGAFVFDFVSIHPFRDGNGRMSRLLTLLVLYRSGFEVGKYISIESLIEQTKTDYYRVLKESSDGWMANANTYTPFLNYFLSILLQSYRDLVARVRPATTKTSAVALIQTALEEALKPLSKRELMGLIPTYSEVTIARELNALLNEKKIVKVGQGRSTKYRLV